MIFFHFSLTSISVYNTVTCHFRIQECFLTGLPSRGDVPRERGPSKNGVFLLFAVNTFENGDKRIHRVVIDEKYNPRFAVKTPLRNENHFIRINDSGSPGLGRILRKTTIVQYKNSDDSTNDSMSNRLFFIRWDRPYDYDQYGSRLKTGRFGSNENQTFFSILEKNDVYTVEKDIRWTAVSKQLE